MRKSILGKALELFGMSGLVLDTPQEDLIKEVGGNLPKSVGNNTVIEAKTDEIKTGEKKDNLAILNGERRKQKDKKPDKNKNKGNLVRDFGMDAMSSF